MIAHVARSYRAITNETEDDVQLGSNLLTDINGHTTQFPTTTFGTAMTAFATIQTNYAGLVTAAQGGDATAVSVRNQYRKLTWLPAVDGIANLVNVQAAGDPSIILLS